MGEKQHASASPEVSDQQQTPPLAPLASTPLLDEMLDKGSPNKEARDDFRTRFTELLRRVKQEGITGELKAHINSWIVKLDTDIAKQVNAVMHYPAFQKLEASWRGLQYLVNSTETGPDLKINVLDMSKEELYDALGKSDVKARVERTPMYRKIYSSKYNTPGAPPFGVLIGDYTFGHQSRDMAILQKMSNVAAAAHAPFIAAAEPYLFNVNSFTDLENLVEAKDLTKVFEGPEFARWRAFRRSDDARYVGLTLPRMLLRLPYSPEDVKSFHFIEDVDGKDHSKYLWGNAAFAFAARLTAAYAKYGWCTAIRGYSGGGKVEDLHTHTFVTDEGRKVMKSPTEITMDDDLDQQLSNLGFIPLSHHENTDYAVFRSAQSVNEPKVYQHAPEATASARLSARLQYTMAVSRFAHYLKVMMRDVIGEFKSREECERELDYWINGYANNTPGMGQEMRAQYPLKAAQVEVFEVPDNRGVYRAVARLVPHYQLEAITVALRLVTELPRGARQG